MFARHGIADHLMSDNMPFASCEFQAFAKEWRVKTDHIESDICTVERANRAIVSVVKQMLRKADEEGRDPYLALLASQIACKRYINVSIWLESLHYGYG